MLGGLRNKQFIRKQLQASITCLLRFHYIRASNYLASSREGGRLTPLGGLFRLKSVNYNTSAL
jgi:hypothetical protein